MQGKYSPTVNHAYFLNQNWFNDAVKYGQDGFGYDAEGYDSYGYNAKGVDRAGYSENDYIAHDDFSSNFERIFEIWSCVDVSKGQRPKVNASEVLGQIIDLMRNSGVKIVTPYDFENFMDDNASHSQLFATKRFEAIRDKE